MQKKLISFMLAIILLLFPSVVSASKYADTTLTIGSSGPSVTKLQEDLRTLKYYTYPTVTGNFGPVTEGAIRALQQDFGLQTNGAADLTTQNVLQKEIDATVNVKLNGQAIDFPDAQPYTTPNYRTLVPIRFVSETLGYKIDWTMVADSQIKVTITAQGKTVILNTNSRTAYVDGQAVTLDEAAFIKRGRTHVPLRFIMETFNAKVDWDNANHTVLISTTGVPSTPPTEKPTVIIDPGHGGEDVGTIAVDGSYEKTMTLQIALQAKAALIKKGYNVVLTREIDTAVFPHYTDVRQDLQARVDFVQRYNAKLFISLHGNSFSQPTAYGTETFFDTSLNPQPTKSKQLAGILETKTTAALKTYARGITDNDFYVLRNNSVAAALLELGFMSNPDDLKKLKDPAYQASFAEEFANGIEDYFLKNPS